ncbi:MAG: hypothetical protein ACYCO3_14745 [Mycobacteriales bacterium]
MADQAVFAVSAEEYLSVLRTHADRVHDMLRRLGCDPQAAAEITTGSALELLQALVHRPEEVGDPTGWWFNRALRTGRRVAREAAPARPTADAPLSLLTGTSGEAQILDALEALPANERLAVLLRDAYDLPAPTVAAALRLADPVSVYAAGRLALIEHYDERSFGERGFGESGFDESGFDESGFPESASHPGRNPVSLAELTRLADGSLSGARAAMVGRHVARCPDCEEIVAASAKARRLLAGLPVLALSDADRDALLDAAQERAEMRLAGRALLPATEQYYYAEPAAPSRATVALALLAAVGLGVLTGYLTRHLPAHSAAPLRISAPRAASSITPTPSPSAAPPPPAAPSPSPPPSPTPSPPAPVSSPSPSVRPSPSPTRPVAPAVIAISPTSGPNGTVVSVSGRNFAATVPVVVQFVDSAGAVTSSTNTISSATGTFTATVSAEDPSLLPTTCRVVASGGNRSATAPFHHTIG